MEVKTWNCETHREGIAVLAQRGGHRGPDIWGLGKDAGLFNQDVGEGGVGGRELMAGAVSDRTDLVGGQGSGQLRTSTTETRMSLSPGEATEPIPETLAVRKLAADTMLLRPWSTVYDAMSWRSGTCRLEPPCGARWKIAASWLSE